MDKIYILRIESDKENKLFVDYKECSVIDKEYNCYLYNNEDTVQIVEDYQISKSVPDHLIKNQTYYFPDTIDKKKIHALVKKEQYEFDSIYKNRCQETIKEYIGKLNFYIGKEDTVKFINKCLEDNE